MTPDDLRSLIRYNPGDGSFVWLRKPAKRILAGSVAGTLRGGRIFIVIGGKSYAASRLAWLYMTGQWPSGVVDHINGFAADNRWANLRDVSRRVNNENQRCARSCNRAGLLGVTPHHERFRARIKVRGVTRDLGLHATPELAHAAYVAAKRELHEGNTL